LYPIPSQELVMEWDCSFIPNDLGTNSDPDALPEPWHNPARLYAAYLGLSMKAAELSDPNQVQITVAMSDRYFKLFEKFMVRARTFSNPAMVSSWYGRRF